MQKKDKAAALLESDGFWLLTRLLLAVVFLSGGAAKLLMFGEGVQEMQAFGLEPAWLVNSVVGISLVIGALMILANRYLCLAAAGLSVFLVLTILVVHTFWSMPQPQSLASMHIALEHISLIGGLLGTAIASHFRSIMFEQWSHAK